MSVVNMNGQMVSVHMGHLLPLKKERPTYLRRQSQVKQFARLFSNRSG